MQHCGRFLELGSTVNITAFGLTKAFDKVNHHAMFMKLMEQHIPVNLLNILEKWLSFTLVSTQVAC